MNQWKVCLNPSRHAPVLKTIHWSYTGTNLLRQTTLQGWRCSSKQQHWVHFLARYKVTGDRGTDGRQMTRPESQDSGESRRGRIWSSRAEATVVHIRPHSQHTQTNATPEQTGFSLAFPVNHLKCRPWTLYKQSLNFFLPPYHYHTRWQMLTLA